MLKTFIIVAFTAAVVEFISVVVDVVVVDCAPTD